MRRTVVALLAAIVLSAGYFWHCWQLRHWGAWLSFARVFVQADGRVIDRTAGSRSTSEAQAYTLFFALVANDRARFERVLHWMVNNLAEGSLETNLPAWLWGLREDGSWGVRDANPAKLDEEFEKICSVLAATRPTAVNLDHSLRVHRPRCVTNPACPKYALRDSAVKVYPDEPRPAMPSRRPLPGVRMMISTIHFAGAAAADLAQRNPTCPKPVSGGVPRRAVGR